MGRIRLNETNLLLFSNNRLIFQYMQSIGQKNKALLVNQVFIRGLLRSLTKHSAKILTQNRGQRIELFMERSRFFENPIYETENSKPPCPILAGLSLEIFTS